MAEAEPHIEESREAAPAEIRAKLKALERRDWWLWATAVTVLLLLSSALFVMEMPVLFRDNDVLHRPELDIAVRGLFGLVLLFSVFAIYQQFVIKNLRSKMAAQIGIIAALQTRAEVFEKLAILDPLTGLFNRRFAGEHLPAEMARAERLGYPFTLLMLDLNGFKEINDIHGHATGDLALREFAHALKKCVRSSDLPVRMGGDEFMVLLPECRAYSVPHALARLRGLSVAAGDREIALTFAAGWAEHQPGETPERLIERADAALYNDKRTGRAAQQVDRAEEDARHGQKLQVVGQMTGRVVHDFNNLLTVIKGYAELVLSGMSAGDNNRGRVEDIRKAADHAAQLTGQLLAFTRRQGVQARVIDINRQLREMDSLLRPMLGDRIALEIRSAEKLSTVRLQNGHFEQIVLNLLTNARDAIYGSGIVTIDTASVELDTAFVDAHPGSRPGQYVTLSVSDTGVGIEAKVAPHIFEPFFTTKPTGKANGLGLASVYGAVKQAGGYIDFESRPNRGTRFTVYLPQYQEPEFDEEPVAPRMARERATVLVVESVNALRSLACEFLRGEGFAVLEAATATDALEIAGRHEGKIDVAVADLVLPGVSCREMRDALLERRPDLKMLYIVGYPDLGLPLDDLLATGSVLETPFSPSELARKVRELLGDRAVMAASAHA